MTIQPLSSGKPSEHLWLASCTIIALRVLHCVVKPHCQAQTWEAPRSASLVTVIFSCFGIFFKSLLSFFKPWHIFFTLRESHCTPPTENVTRWHCSLIMTTYCQCILYKQKKNSKKVFWTKSLKSDDFPWYSLQSLTARKCEMLHCKTCQSYFVSCTTQKQHWV